LKRLDSKGLTVMELVVGVATAAIIGLVSAYLVKAGIMTYNYSARLDDALTRTRRSLGGAGSATGILESSRSGYAVTALNASTVTVNSPASLTNSYYVNDQGLFRSKSGVGSVQADQITHLAINYYNLDASGLIIESTAAVSAKLVTALVTLQTKSKQPKTVKLFSGAILRNHP
jgi:hypothetical protein